MAERKKLLDKFDKNVQQWAKRIGAIVTIIGAITAGASWLISQIDNSLATRIESQTAEMQQEIQKLSNKVDAQDKQTELQLTRLELMSLMENDPENIVGIERLAKEYFSPPLNGNSYMTELYSKWAKQYGGDLSITIK